MSDEEPQGEHDEAQQAWEQLPGETTKQFNAFKTYCNLPADKRGAGAVAKALGLKSKRRLCTWRSDNRWVERVRLLDEWKHSKQIEEDKDLLVKMARRHAGLADNMTMLAYMHLEANVKAVKKQLSEGKVPTYLKPREVMSWIKEGARLEAESRQRLTDPEIVGLAADTSNQALDLWRRQFVQPDGSFNPHRLQREMINSKQRYQVAVAGIQSGKTSGSAISMHERIQNDRERLHAIGRRGFYWMVAPNSIVGEVMCEAFEKWAPPGSIVDVKGNHSGKTWTMSDGARVQFRSGERADTLVGRAIDGVWCDEFTLLKKDVWVTSLRQRLATTDGWALFSGTPRGRNWAWEEIWRRCLPEDDKYDPAWGGFTWHSQANPAISLSEIEAAKRDLPPAYFRREWQASWEAFHGQIYEHWSRTRHVVSDVSALISMQGAKIVFGVDWGFAKAGAIAVILCLLDGTRIVIKEVYAQGKLPGWWTKTIAKLWKKYRPETIWCDPAEPGSIGTLVEEGMPARKANNERHDGIKHLASLAYKGRFLMDKSCTVSADQIEAYHWKEDRSGNRSEIPVKENDHMPDAIRYGIFSEHKEEMRGKGNRQVSYGGTDLA